MFSGISDAENSNTFCQIDWLILGLWTFAEPLSWTLAVINILLKSPSPLDPLTESELRDIVFSNKQKHAHRPATTSITRPFHQSWPILAYDPTTEICCYVAIPVSHWDQHRTSAFQCADLLQILNYMKSKQLKSVNICIVFCICIYNCISKCCFVFISKSSKSMTGEQLKSAKYCSVKEGKSKGKTCPAYLWVDPFPFC